MRDGEIWNCEFRASECSEKTSMLVGEYFQDQESEPMHLLLCLKCGAKWRTMLAIEQIARIMTGDKKQPIPNPESWK